MLPSVPGSWAATSSSVIEVIDVFRLFFMVAVDDVVAAGAFVARNEVEQQRRTGWHGCVH